MKTKDIVLCGLLAAVMFVLQVAFGFLPNIEPVSILVIVFTLVLERKTLVIIYTCWRESFTALEFGGSCICMCGQFFILSSGLCEAMKAL